MGMRAGSRLGIKRPMFVYARAGQTTGSHLELQSGVAFFVSQCKNGVIKGTLYKYDSFQLVKSVDYATLLACDQAFSIHLAKEIMEAPSDQSC